jgi:uncharacterized membrane protein YoaK (UPF0700 family)
MDHGRRDSLRRKLYTYLRTDVREDLLLEAEMLVLAFATGIGDATTYSEYRVFTANHTGNTLLLAVGVTENSSHQPPVGKIPIPLNLIGVSLSMFIVGSSIIGQLGNLAGSRQRWWLLLNNFFQMLLFLTASLLQTRYSGWDNGPRSAQLDTGAVSMGVVALLAFAAGGQVAMARSLNMTEITTANATSCYVDLMIDKRLFEAKNRRRNRRILFIACLSAGSFAGGFAYQKYGSSITLFISSIGKIAVTTMLFFNKGGFWTKGILTQSEEASDSGLTFASRTEKDSSAYFGSRNAGIPPEKPKYGEFDYRGTQPSTLFDKRASRDTTSRFAMGNIFDLSDMHVHLQIPSWNITAGGYRRIPGA